ncbi:MAG: YfhO family protein, partial [Acutalibacteraceae bacterium]
GKISLEKPKLICLSVPYADGWSLYVDGEKTDPIIVNYLYIGAELSAGDHEIKIVYNTPDLKLGAVISAVGLALLFGICIYYKVQSRSVLSSSKKKSKK